MAQDITFHYTPEALASKLVSLVEIHHSDVLLEPFKGGGSFYNQFPAENVKDWCEIDEGRDFFQYEGSCDIIITNPPFKSNEVQRNILIKCMDKCFDVCRKKVCVLINSKCFNSLTPLRLHHWSQRGWVITNVHICNVSKWFGRYYFVTFEKDKQPIMTFDITNY